MKNKSNLYPVTCLFVFLLHKTGDCVCVYARFIRAYELVLTAESSPSADEISVEALCSVKQQQVISTSGTAEVSCVNNKHTEHHSQLSGLSCLDLNPTTLGLTTSSARAFQVTALTRMERWAMEVIK